MAREVSNHEFENAERPRLNAKKISFPSLYSKWEFKKQFVDALNKKKAVFSIFVNKSILDNPIQ